MQVINCRAGQYFAAGLPIFSNDRVLTKFLIKEIIDVLISTNGKDWTYPRPYQLQPSRTKERQS